MAYFQEKTVIWDGEPLEEIDLELRGEIVVGNFVDTERETFRERLLKYWPAWPGAPPPKTELPTEPAEEKAGAARAPIERLEVRIAGAGGQGIMLAGALLGAAASIHDERNAVTIPSYGPESRGGASKSDIVISDQPIEYPEVSHPNVLVIAFQEAYDKYKQPRAADCTLIVEQDLIQLDDEDVGKAWAIPALEWARETDEPRVFNMILLGFLTAIGRVASAEAMRKAIGNLGRLTEKNLAAFDRGYEHGVAMRTQSGDSGPDGKAVA
jgi:2-oxoglutarate ferredoxin oxidoreductase subunit gamma